MTAKSVQAAQALYWRAGEIYQTVAIEELTRAVEERLPEARWLLVTCILLDDYSEHNVNILDENNKVLDSDWLLEDETWFMLATEGVGVDRDELRIYIPKPDLNAQVAASDEVERRWRISEELEKMAKDIEYQIARLRRGTI